jgi:hypothetical protein
MAQITIYIDKETAERLRVFTQARRISQSQWIAGLIRESLRTEWPDAVVELAGAWEDLPTAEVMREEMGKDVPREVL